MSFTRGEDVGLAPCVGTEGCLDGSPGEVKNERRVQKDRVVGDERIVLLLERHEAFDELKACGVAPLEALEVSHDAETTQGSRAPPILETLPAGPLVLLHCSRLHFGGHSI